MKYKVAYNKFHLIFMTSILLLCLISCLLWLQFDKYLYFSIYFILSIGLGYIYYFTSYELRKEELIIHLGFIPVKIKYKNILEIKEENQAVVIKNLSSKLKIYPEKRQEFIKELKIRSGK